jgi:hypothetical protein
MRYTFATLAVIAVALLATAAVGEETNPIAIGYHAPSFPFSPPEAWHDHSSTALEGALRGKAVLTQAQGTKNLLDAQSRVVNQHARSLSYDNDVKFTYSRFQIKELKESYRDLQHQRSLQRRYEGKQLHDERDQDLAETYRLTDYEFNWNNGSIYWPAWVAGPRYGAHRHRIAVLVDQMYRYGLAGDKFYREELARACDSLRDQLRDDAQLHKELRVQDYLETQRFLVGLKYMPHLLDPAADLMAMNER